MIFFFKNFPILFWKQQFFSNKNSCLSLFTRDGISLLFFLLVECKHPSNYSLGRVMFRPYFWQKPFTTKALLPFNFKGCKGCALNLYIWFCLGIYHPKSTHDILLLDGCPYPKTYTYLYIKQLLIYVSRCWPFNIIWKHLILQGFNECV
jgi:hypothetical protein